MVYRIRRISCNEQLYLDMQDSMSTFSMQFVLEYEGIIDKHKLEDAINFVLSSTNDSNLMLLDEWWVKSNENVDVEFVEIIKEDLYEDNFFKEKIDYTKHSFKVYLLKHYGKKYIVFKLLHSVSDGKGALLLIENIFRKLKNEELLKCTNSFSECDLAKDIAIHNKKINLVPKVKFKSNINVVKKYTPSWSVFSVDRYCSGIIAKIASVLSKYFENDNINFMIPVDIRKHLDKYHLGNMTLPIFLTVSKNETWEEINGSLLYALKNKEELNKKSIQYFGYKSMPKFFRKLVIKFIKRYFNAKRLYMNGSIISYLGRIDIKKFSNEMFEIIDFVSLPLQTPFSPFSIVVVETNNKMNIAISRYDEQIDCSKFDEIKKDIREKFEYEIYEKINANKRENIEDCLENIINQINKNSNLLAVNDYTYKDLENMVNKIMMIIHKNNVKKNDSVILYMSRTYEFICSMIACMKMCITFIPIDASFNIEKIKDIVEDSKSKLVLFNGDNLGIDIKKVKIDAKNQEKVDIVKGCSHNKNDIVYKIYTSGTTGKPKEIEISYNNLSNYLTWAKSTYIIKERLVMPLFTSISVDLTLTSILLPLITGGKIKVISSKFSYDVLYKILNDKEINIIKATPSHLSLIDTTVDSNIRKIIVGGENFSSKLAENIKNYFSNDLVIYNEYGPTETTVGCVYSQYIRNGYTNVPIGKCINNTKGYLIDENNKIITSCNIEGELIIAGDGVSQGLINKNSESILRINNELFYRTGDICFIKDNMLHCVGRINNQVKIRGNRVELDGINNVVLLQQNIFSAYSLFCNNKIVLFICSKDQIDTSIIKDKLRRELPDYMQPNIIIQIEKLPIKSNGKIDIDSLKEKVGFDNKIDVDKIFHIIVDDNNKMYDNESIETLGIDSLDTLKLIHFLSENKSDEFSNELLKRIAKMRIADIRNFVKGWCK